MHPKEILDPQLVAIIRKYTSEAEQKKRLPEQVLELLYKKDALRVMIPSMFEGGEWPLPQVVRFFEALAWADGNTGWLVNLGAGANMFAGYFEEKIARTIFQDARVWCAGSGAPSGKAFRTAGGYEVTGRWKYASGSAHATHFTANAILHDESGRVVLKEGKPDFRSFIFKRSSVTIFDTWHTTGLCATSSNDFAVSQLFVPDARVFSLTKPSAFARGALYRFPFEVLALVNMACMLTGMALHFLDLFHELAAEKKPLYGDGVLKENEVVKQIMEEATPPFITARQNMYEILQKAWDCYEKGTVADNSLLDNTKQAASAAAAKGRQMVYELYPLCGMNIVFSSSAINKVWRDMAVASQHYLLSPLSG